MTDTGRVSPIAGIPETILVAPDAFTGTFSATAVAGLIGRGLQDSGRSVDLCPVADGGEGTLEALAHGLGAEPRETQVTGPLGQPLTARWALAGDVAIIETPAAGGLGFLDADERDAGSASTTGTGELVLAAAAEGARTIYVGAGGSAAIDGGAGAVGAIERGGGLGRARVVVLCDVRTPFEAAAPWAVFGAELVRGAVGVLDAVGFDARMRAARAVITGEGTLDQRSLVGRVVSEVATRARQAGVPCHAVAGVRELDTMGQRVLDLDRVLVASTADELLAAGRELAALI